MDTTVKILAWSSQQDLWQQDALRRLAIRKTLSSQDMDELFAMLKVEHGLLEANQAVVPEPLTAAHLPDTSAHPDEVALLAISGVEDAARLKPGETLSFSA